MAPPTAASNLRSTPAASAASNSSPPWVASSSLLAVTTGLPRRIAPRFTQAGGPSTPHPTPTSGSAPPAAASPVTSVGSTAGSRLRVTSRTATRCRAIGVPARSRSGRPCSTSSLATPVPTAPHPSIPILSPSTSPPVIPSMAGPSCRTAPPPRELHPLRRVDPDQAEGVGQDLAGGVDQPPAGAGQGVVVAEDPALGVEAVEGGGQVLGVAGQAVGGALDGRHQHQLLEGGQAAQQGGLHRVAEQPQVGLLERQGREPRLAALAQDAGDAGVGVLDVVDRSEEKQS